MWLVGCLRGTLEYKNLSAQAALFYYLSLSVKNDLEASRFNFRCRETNFSIECIQLLEEEIK